MSDTLPPFPPPRIVAVASAAALKRTSRQTILETARALLDQEGAAALSMREVARRAGVTHQAPYHHFPDREAILGALVAQGFDELADRLAAANALAPTRGPRATILASGQAYVGFAMANPGVFRIMFRRDVCDAAKFPEARQASERAHAELENLVHIAHGAQAGAALATIYWAHVHGLASLLSDGPLASLFTTEQDYRSHLEQVATQFTGLMLNRSDTGRE